MKSSSGDKLISPNPLPFYLKLSQITIGLVAFTYAMFIGQDIIVPFVFALIIAILLNPVVGLLQRIGFNRVLAILTAVLLAFIVLVVLFYFIFTQASMFTDELPQLKIKFNAMFEEIINWISSNFNVSIKKIHEWIIKQKGEGLSKSPAIISKTLVTVSGVLFTVLLIPVYVFMILFYKTLLIKFVSCLFPKENNVMVKEVLTETKNLIQSYLVGLSIEAGMVAILNAAALLIIGIQYAILIAVIGALLNTIPYIGGLIAIALPVIIAIATLSPSAALWVVIAYIIVQFIDNHYIVPYIVASKVKINGLISIIVVLIGGALWGVAGMFLSIPLTAILKVIFDRIEPLKPWGILLGDDMPEDNKRPVTRKRKQSKK